MILIGSKAIKYWYPDFPREPKDTDYAVKSLEGLKGSKDVEYLLNPILVDYMTETYMQDEIAYPSVLYTLKISHMFWDIFWSKHLFDIQFLKEKGHTVKIDLFYKLYEYWKEVHGKNKRSDLKMTSKEFFNNAIKCPYEHDYLHTLIKEIPTYTKVLIGEVEVSEDKFNLLTFEEKCDLVQEEIYVMAWERFNKLDYRKGYEIMLKQFIMNHAPIWEAIFILDNYKYLYRPKVNYYNFFKELPLWNN